MGLRELLDQFRDGKRPRPRNLGDRKTLVLRLADFLQFFERLMSLFAIVRTALIL